MDVNDIREQAVERIYLVPMAEDGGLHYVWCDDPAPGVGMDSSEAVEYVRKDVHDAALEREQALAATVDRLRNEWEKKDAGSVSDQAKLDRLVDILYSTPATSLARCDLLKQVEALEAIYEQSQGSMIINRGSLIDEARKLRRQAEGGA